MSRNHTRRRCGVFGISFVIFSLAFLAPCLRAHAQPVTATEKEELLLYFYEDQIVSTATKQALPLAKIPAVATVITAEQIRNMGARTLLEALKVVPGIGVYQNFTYDKSIEVRGIKTFNSEKVLVLMDGIRLNAPYSGGAVLLYGDMPMDNVKRIEIIRGPLSALYGADAFLGVINVITMEGGEIDGVEARAGGGSFSTHRYNILAGGKYGDLQAAAQVNYLESDGNRRTVERDAAGASGKTLYWRKRLETGITLSWKDLKLEYLYTNKHLGPYIGMVSALNDETHLRGTGDIAEISYKKSLVHGLDITARLYRRHFTADFYWEMYPEGFLGIFPDGVLSNPRAKNRVLGAEIQADYVPFKNNVLTVGVNLERIRQYDVQSWTNSGPTGLPLPGGFQDVSSTRNWNPNVHRNISAWYLQDTWKVTDRLSLVAGARHDEYSDFGKTTNPRGGIVWEAAKGTYLKALAGRSFRAPTFSELYNPAGLTGGNADLKPERITTTEVSVETRALKPLTLSVSYFKNYLYRTIQLQPVSAGVSRYANSGRSRYAGVEVEARYDFNKTDNTYANLTWLEPKRLGSGGEITDIPKWRSNIGANVAFARYFNFNANAFISGDRPRAAGDWRKDIPAYAVIDSTLTFKNFWKGLEIQLAAKNLLDKRYDDPAQWNTQTNSVSVPGDYPRDGREVFLEARYTF